VACFIYHGFYEHPEELAGVPPGETRYYLSVAQLERHLDCLAERGFQACSVADYLSAPGSAKKRAILTFDDGHISNYTRAWPLLQARGFRGTFFVVADWVGRPDRMNRDQLRELVRSGMSVGSHGLTHTPLSSLRPDKLDHELTRSRQILEDMLDARVTHLALPGGFSSATVFERARRAGYECVCTSAPGWSRPGAVMNRISVTSVTDRAVIGALAGLDSSVMLRRRASHGLIRGVKSIIGRSAYEKVCAAFLRRASGQPGSA
jgi:peptidoglycan/xylan/chitin deacetylase (PgdA/CDA1 family)